MLPQNWESSEQLIVRITKFGNEIEPDVLSNVPLKCFCSHQLLRQSIFYPRLALLIFNNLVVHNRFESTPISDNFSVFENQQEMDSLVLILGKTTDQNVRKISQKFQCQYTPPITCVFRHHCHINFILSFFFCSTR